MDMMYYAYLLIGIAAGVLIETVNGVKGNDSGLGLIAYLLIMIIYLMFQIKKEVKKWKTN